MYYWIQTSCINSKSQNLAYKILEFMAQLLIVVVTGGLIMQKYNQNQVRKVAINEFRKDTLADLISSYSGVKKVRRNMRAKMEMIFGVEQVYYNIYDHQMVIINDIQLSLEVVKRELRIFSGAFDDPGGLTEHVRAMENYLGALIDEYEKNLRNYSVGSGIPVAKLERLKCFIERGDNTDFGVFAQAFQGALLLLQAERIKVA